MPGLGWCRASQLAIAAQDISDDRALELFNANPWTKEDLSRSAKINLARIIYTELALRELRRCGYVQSRLDGKKAFYRWL